MAGKEDSVTGKGDSKEARINGRSLRVEEKSRTAFHSSSWIGHALWGGVSGFLGEKLRATLGPLENYSANAPSDCLQIGYLAVVSFVSVRNSQIIARTRDESARVGTLAGKLGCCHQVHVVHYVVVFCG